MNRMQIALDKVLDLLAFITIFLLVVGSLLGGLLYFLKILKIG